MFSKKITDTDLFLDMPMSAQCLYFHLNMEADDDGFLGNAKTVRRKIGASEDDFKLLMAKEFIIPFESGVVVIKDWKIHNYIQKDRYNRTIFFEEKSMLTLDKNNRYQFMDTECIQDVSNADTQVRLGKDRLDKDIKKNSVEQSSTMSELFEKIWKTYPKKTNKKKAKEQFLKKFKSEEDLDQFKKGYRNYLAYIKSNDWYHPQELFRWIRDERFNDEYDLSETTTQVRYLNPPVRQEQLPDWVNEPKQEEEKLSPEKQAELDRQIKEFLEGKS